MLEDGFKSGKYSAILSNLKEGGFLTSEEVNVLINGYISKRIIVLDSISDEKARIVSETLIDNYNRLKSK
jgi:hypothetical protein